MELPGEMERAGNVDVKRRLSARICARLAGRAPARGEAGFSLMEAVLAMALFAIVATALVGVLVSGVSVQSLSRQKTIAEQAGTARLEYVRTLSLLQRRQPGREPERDHPAVADDRAGARLRQPGPVRDGDEQGRVEQQPERQGRNGLPERGFLQEGHDHGHALRRKAARADGDVRLRHERVSGVNDAEIDVNVLDIGNNTPISGQLVNLTTGPSAPLSDTSDAAGDLVFPALSANPTSGPTAFYNLSMAPLSGYTLLKDDDITQTPASATAHVQLAPSQMFPTTLRVYKGSTIDVDAAEREHRHHLSRQRDRDARRRRSAAAPPARTSAYPGGDHRRPCSPGEKIIPT